MKKIVSALVLLALVGASGYFAWSWQKVLREDAQLRDRLAALTADNKKVEEAIQRLHEREKEIENTRFATDRTQKQLKASYLRALMQTEKLMRENAQLKARLTQLDESKLTYAKDLQAARDRIDAKEAEIAAFKERLADLQTSWKKLETDNAKILEGIQKVERTAPASVYPPVMPIDYSPPRDLSRVGEVFKLDKKSGRQAETPAEDDPESRLSEEEKSQLARETAVTHYNLGVAYMEKSEFRRAADEFERALIFDGDDPLPHYNLALIYDLHLPDPRKAIDHYETYLTLSPNAEDLKKVKYRIFQMRLQEEKGIGFDLSKQR